MDINQLGIKIDDISHETISCIKMLQSNRALFKFDEETNDSLDKFLDILQIKAIRACRPRDKKDITENMNIKEIERKW